MEIIAAVVTYVLAGYLSVGLSRGWAWKGSLGQRVLAGARWPYDLYRWVAAGNPEWLWKRLRGQDV